MGGANIITTGYWSESGIRIMVMLSLTLQIILIAPGNFRKHSRRKWIRGSLWMAYLYADEVAIVTLGLLSREFLDSSSDAGDRQNYAITATWAAFLILHLGGPDTMTAYSLEDNQLWQRHLFTLIAQLFVACIVFRGVWSTATAGHAVVSWKLVVTTIAVFVAGAIKCGERIWIQRSGESDRFKSSMFPDPDPGPNYARYMDEYRSKRDEGYKVSSGRITEAPTVGDHIYSSPNNTTVPDAADLQDAYTFFKFCKQMFADLILSVHEIVNSLTYFQNRRSVDVFRVVEIELGFIYDVLYTKTALIHSRNGALLRALCLALLALAFVLFGLHVGRGEAEGYSRADVITTWTLLAAAAFLELYSLLLVFSSDWTMLYVSKHRNRALDMFYKAVSLVMPSRNKRWSNSIRQRNLLSFCLRPKDPDSKRPERVTPDLKELVFDQLLKKPSSARREIRVKRARWNLESADLSGRCPDKIKWSIEEAELDESILVWHIATDLCYHMESGGTMSNTKSKSNSKRLSQYMLYLLLERPAMLPNGIGEIRYQDTRAETKEFFGERKSIKDERTACESLLDVSTEILPSQVKGDRSKSVLFDACRLAKDLRALDAEAGWGSEKKWELISQVWVEMLCYAASQCGTNQHARQLCEGGELLTHVWLLMAHLGITDQFQISKGHARAKLIVH